MPQILNVSPSLAGDQLDIIQQSFYHRVGLLKGFRFLDLEKIVVCFLK